MAAELVMRSLTHVRVLKVVLRGALRGRFCYSNVVLEVTIGKVVIAFLVVGISEGIMIETLSRLRRNPRIRLKSVPRGEHIQVRPTVDVAAENEILTIFKVWDRVEGQAIGIEGPWSTDFPGRVSAGKQVELGVNEDPGVHGIAQCATKRVWRKH